MITTHLRMLIYVYSLYLIPTQYCDSLACPPLILLMQRFFISLATNHWLILNNRRLAFNENWCILVSLYDLISIPSAGSTYVCFIVCDTYITWTRKCSFCYGGSSQMLTILMSWSCNGFFWGKREHLCCIIPIAMKPVYKHVWRIVYPVNLMFVAFVYI